jgi:hypothetical protein
MERRWEAAALAAAGVVLAVVLSILANTAAEAWTGRDAEAWPLLPLAAVAAFLWWHWRTAPVAWAFGMAAATIAFLAAVSTSQTLAGLAILLACAAVVATHGPPALRLAGVLPYAWGMALVVSEAAAQPSVAPLSGILLVGLVALYPVAVAWSLEGWLRHVAWAAGLTWCLVAVGVALGDLLLGRDPATVLGVAFTGALALAMAAGWLLQGQPRPAR